MSGEGTKYKISHTQGQTDPPKNWWKTAKVHFRKVAPAQPKTTQKPYLLWVGEGRGSLRRAILYQLPGILIGGAGVSLN